MAENLCPEPGLSRRASFRKSLQDQTLPQDFFIELDKKRRQLDESIQKYIASKDREYQQFAVELRQTYVRRSEEGSAEQDAAKRRPSSDSTVGPRDAQSSELHAPDQNAVSALLSATLRRSSDSGQVLTPEEDERPLSAGLVDRKASMERDKDFVGVFTPSFMPALADKDLTSNALERSVSAPATMERLPDDADGGQADHLPRASSDSAVPAKAHRPTHLQHLAQRTSSSGSSVDAKLTSAMKSPAHSQRARPKQKRVSLAVGDSIVAPSDNVPVALHSNSTPSHSKPRGPGPECGVAAALIEHHALAVNADETARGGESAVSVVPNGVSGDARKDALGEVQTDGISTAASSVPDSTQITSRQSPLAVDADGDLFDLDAADLEESPIEADEPEDTLETDEKPAVEGIVSGQATAQPIGILPGSNFEYDAEAGMVHERDPDTEDAIHVDVRRGSSDAAQQPTKPGFRRPSVISDPVFRGPDYQAVEEKAAEDEVYGSSFSRPPSKGSFTSGSLGESFMAKHAQQMERLRVTQQEGQMRS